MAAMKNFSLNFVRFQVFPAANMKMAGFWDAAPCSLVEVALMMEAASTSETSVKFHQTTWRSNSKDIHLHSKISDFTKIRSEVFQLLHTDE
jgi:hypothetical protein